MWTLADSHQHKIRRTIEAIIFRKHRHTIQVMAKKRMNTRLKAKANGNLRRRKSLIQVILFNLCFCVTHSIYQISHLYCALR